MPTGSNFLDIKDFNLEPYHTDHEGDSGALFLATSKKDSAVQYIVKSAMPELACNEYMYHKAASALGLYTQEVRLFLPSPRFRYAAGIRYEKNAREATQADLSVGASCFPDFIAFQTLYVILNEEDSQEYYLDGDGRLFKLDNAASFNMQSYNVAMLNTISEDEAIEKLKRKLAHTEYSKYAINLQLITEHYGEAGRNACLAMFERFTQLNVDALEEAVDDVSEVYSIILGEYYYAFFESRKKLCARFLKEIDNGE